MLNSSGVGFKFRSHSTSCQGQPLPAGDVRVTKSILAVLPLETVACDHQDRSALHNIRQTLTAVCLNPSPTGADLRTVCLPDVMIPASGDGTAKAPRS